MEKSTNLGVYTIFRETLFKTQPEFQHEVMNLMMDFILLKKGCSYWYYGDGIYPNWSFKNKPFVTSIKIQHERKIQIINPCSLEDWKNNRDMILSVLNGCFIQHNIDRWNKGLENKRITEEDKRKHPDIPESFQVKFNEDVPEFYGLNSQLDILRNLVYQFPEGNQFVKIHYMLTNFGQKEVGNFFISGIETSKIKISFVGISRPFLEIRSKHMGEYTFTINPEYGYCKVENEPNRMYLVPSSRIYRPPGEIIGVPSFTMSPERLEEAGYLLSVVSKQLSNIDTLERDLIDNQILFFRRKKQYGHEPSTEDKQDSQ